MGMKDYFMMAAAGLMAAASNEHFDTPAKGPLIYCGSCENCPVKPKTFCKAGGRNTHSKTLVRNCSSYSPKNN